MAGITFKHVEKTYPGNVTAVSDLDLEIQDGEFVVLTGPSGCGKTTALRMIAGLEDATGGELYIGGRTMDNVATKDRNVAAVFQSRALYPHMSVYKNIAFGLSLRRLSQGEIDRRVREAARLLALEPLLDCRPRELSNGQRQRVTFARAMVRDPAVYLLDEPLSGLDDNLRATMYAELSRLHRHLQTTFIYATRDPAEAMAMGERVVVMRDGSIQQCGAPQALYDAPCNLFVAGFIGSPGMNFLDAVIAEENGKFSAETCGSSIPLPERMDEGALGPYVGRAVVLGVRPEDLSPAAPVLNKNRLHLFDKETERAIAH